MFMIQTLLGKKIEQKQAFLENGVRLPITKISVPDNTVLQVKTLAKDKYSAVQIGFGQKKNSSKPELLHAKKAGFDFAPQVIKEIKVSESQEAELPKGGQQLKLEEVFKPGDIVDVTGTSKGKGFAGVVKRHNFRGGPKTHGQSDRHRAPGSIGQTTTPGRVYRGKRMSGRMGQDTVTIKNLKIIDIDSENDTILVSGLVPGVKKSVVFLTKVGEDKKFVPLFKEELAEEQTAQKSDELEVQDAKTANTEIKQGNTKEKSQTKEVEQVK